MRLIILSVLISILPSSCCRDSTIEEAIVLAYDHILKKIHAKDSIMIYKNLPIINPSKSVDNYNLNNILLNQKILFINKIPSINKSHLDSAIEIFGDLLHENTIEFTYYYYYDLLRPTPTMYPESTIFNVRYKKTCFGWKKIDEDFDEAAPIETE